MIGRPREKFDGKPTQTAGTLRLLMIWPAPMRMVSLMPGGLQPLEGEIDIEESGSERINIDRQADRDRGSDGDRDGEDLHRTAKGANKRDSLVTRNARIKAAEGQTSSGFSSDRGGKFEQALRASSLRVLELKLMGD
ncbi:hypothetical protein EUGRSUZ_A01553 [Eucalyptus grandis]|uniref:Uncharacterized protein n=2 Tax=Eucalyptus grandis TaxID=71139 RepID=A0ACC3M430_EUCGR|nr:hypothetical protein EUGRSUZ_A01553 [Eucalyptus grandis]